MVESEAPGDVNPRGNPLRGEEFMKLQNPWFKLKGMLNAEDAKAVAGLEAVCTEFDGTAFKLELDYKLGAAAQGRPEDVALHIDEFMAYEGDRLVGYLGVNCFGGPGTPPEAMGMVHPDYRKQGIFRALHSLAVSEWRRRGVKTALLLSDGRSSSGKEFVKTTGAIYHHAEYEMYLRDEAAFAGWPEGGVVFRKATNLDAGEVARQNAIYFGEELGSGEGEESEMLLPEVEEQRGMTVYLAESDGVVVGKVHLQLIGGLGGIFGLGVLPEHRGKGLGRAILLEGVRRLRAAGAKEVMLQVATENKNALHLYESCGFKTTSTMEYFELTL